MEYSQTTLKVVEDVLRVTEENAAFLVKVLAWETTGQHRRSPTERTLMSNRPTYSMLTYTTLVYQLKHCENQRIKNLGFVYFNLKVTIGNGRP